MMEPPSRTDGAADLRNVALMINDARFEATVECRTTLADLLRDLGFTGTHLGCEQGACGACTVLVDGRSVRACLMFAAQADACRITTVEGLSATGSFSALQEAFHSLHAVQCGYCTPGILITLTELLRDDPVAGEAAIRSALCGHLCRCTGYQNIVAAALSAVEKHRSAK